MVLNEIRGNPQRKLHGENLIAWSNTVLCLDDSITYDYFKAADWVDHGPDAPYYQVVQNRSILVKTAGMYLVQATVSVLQTSITD